MLAWYSSAMPSPLRRTAESKMARVDGAMGREVVKLREDVRQCEVVSLSM